MKESQMSSNDLILLNQLLNQRLSEIAQGMKPSEFFEFFTAGQVLKDDDLTYEEISDGIVDGGGDGGIDSIYFFVNNVLFSEDIDLSSLKRNAHLRLVLVQSKTAAGFSESAIDRLVSSTRDMFDLNKDLADLQSVYCTDLLRKIGEFRDVYLGLTSRFPSVSVHYNYAAKGTTIHPNVKRKVSALEETLQQFISPVAFDFSFLTASDLLTSSRQAPSETGSLRLVESPIVTSQGGFVCLVKLADYLTFITDEGGNIRSHIFEGNVRDYQGKTEVNKEINETLDKVRSEDFWWVNNGVTIICTDTSVSSKVLTIKDPEVVNGLQTSREIYNSLHGKDLSTDPRNLLVRIIKPESAESRDRIIKATNSQTSIPAASLRATDKIHRDIEDFLLAKGYFYDRRKNYYKNIGKPIKKIFSIPYVAQCVMACALQEPGNARARPSSLIKKEDAYRRIFSQQYPLVLYSVCPSIVRRVDDWLKDVRNDKYLKHQNNLRFYISALWVLCQTGSLSPSIDQVASINVTELDTDRLAKVAKTVWENYYALGATDKIAKGTELVTAIQKQEVIDRIRA